ncbi:hypothetical protein, partial [Dolosigranulum pigrum]
ASGFLQIPPHDGHPCLWLIIPTVKAYSGLSPPSCRPCQAHSKQSLKKWHFSRFKDCFLTIQTPPKVGQ